MFQNMITPVGNGGVQKVLFKLVNPLQMIIQI